MTFIICAFIRVNDFLLRRGAAEDALNISLSPNSSCLCLLGRVSSHHNTVSNDSPQLMIYGCTAPIYCYETITRPTHQNSRQKTLQRFDPEMYFQLTPGFALKRNRQQHAGETQPPQDPLSGSHHTLQPPTDTAFTQTSLLHYQSCRNPENLHPSAW